MEITKERAIELLGDKEWDYIYNGILAKEKQIFLAIIQWGTLGGFELLPNREGTFYNLRFYYDYSLAQKIVSYCTVLNVIIYKDDKPKDDDGAI